MNHVYVTKRPNDLYVVTQKRLASVKTLHVGNRRENIMYPGKRNILTLLSVGVVLLAGCAMPTAPSVTLDPMVLEQWRSAQQQVARQYSGEGNPYTVEATEFTWVMKLSPFDCGKIEGVRGCFTGNAIWYMKDTPGAVWHEAGHAILWKLGSEFYRCSFSGHEKYDEC